MIRIKIRELARELGVTSRVVIDRCREAGLPAQNSVTKLDRAQAQRVRMLFADNAADANAGNEPTSCQ